MDRSSMLTLGFFRKHVTEACSFSVSTLSLPYLDLLKSRGHGSH